MLFFWAKNLRFPFKLSASKLTCGHWGEAQILKKTFVEDPDFGHPADKPVEGLGHRGPHPFGEVDDGGHEVPAEDVTAKTLGQAEGNMGELVGSH